jgi:hypothetical protein
MRRVAWRARVGPLRRNHLVPVPAVGSIGQLNLLPIDASGSDLG